MTPREGPLRPPLEQRPPPPGVAGGRRGHRLGRGPRRCRCPAGKGGVGGGAPPWRRRNVVPGIRCAASGVGGRTARRSRNDKGSGMGRGRGLQGRGSPQLTEGAEGDRRAGGSRASPPPPPPPPPTRGAGACSPRAPPRIRRCGGGRGAGAARRGGGPRGAGGVGARHTARGAWTLLLPPRPRPSARWVSGRDG